MQQTFSTPAQASAKGANYQLFAASKPHEQMEVAGGTLVPIVEWLVSERQRIGSAKGRVAVLVRTSEGLTLFVNRVGGSDSSDDGSSDDN